MTRIFWWRIRIQGAFPNTLRHLLHVRNLTLVGIQRANLRFYGIGNINRDGRLGRACDVNREHFVCGQAFIAFVFQKIETVARGREDGL